MQLLFEGERRAAQESRDEKASARVHRQQHLDQQRRVDFECRHDERDENTLASLRFQNKRVTGLG